MKKTEESCPEERFVEIIFTHDHPEETRQIAQTLVEKKLAACAQIIPQITSIYRWQGKIENAQELCVTLKTRAALAEMVCQAIRAMHSYDVPEIMIREVTFGNPDYTRWVCENTGDEKEA